MENINNDEKISISKDENDNLSCASCTNDSKCNYVPANKLQTPANKLKRSHRVIWTPSKTSEKETFRTVVVNYHFSKADKNSVQRHIAKSNSINMNNNSVSTTNTTTSCSSSTGAIPKHNLHYKLRPKVNAKNEEEDEIINLRRLYDWEASKEDLVECNIFDSNKTEEAAANVEDFCKRPITKKPSTQTEEIKLEIYNLPPEQEATIIEPQTEALDMPLEITPPNCPGLIVINGNGDDYETETDSCSMQQTSCQKAIQIDFNTKSTQNPEPSQEAASTQVSIVNMKDKTKLTLETPMPVHASAIPRIRQPKVAPVQMNAKQRQTELHKQRMLVEQKRLELINLKMIHERDEMMREKILFAKELELKDHKLAHYNKNKEQ